MTFKKLTNYFPRPELLHLFVRPTVRQSKRILIKKQKEINVKNFNKKIKLFFFSAPGDVYIVIDQI